MKKHNLAFIDVETTGLDPLRHEIIELAVVLAAQREQALKGPRLELLGEYDWKIKPERLDIADREALRVNGYSPEKWRDAIPLPQVMQEFSAKTKSAAFVAHNVVFDFAFVENAFKKTGVKNEMHYPKIDTISLALGKLYHNPKIEKFSLAALCEHFGIANPSAHTALSDARATFALFEKLTEDQPKLF
ncbi:3'-5' exonuclease [bacterium]|nr:3'-5' exonuclease [bacterium]